MNGKQQNTYDFTHFSKNPTTNVFRRIATMILHITSENLLILNDNIWKETTRSLTLISSVCHMVTHNLSNNATVVKMSTW